MTDLAAAARREFDDRMARYPALVRAGRIASIDASMDAEAWSVIADWIAGQGHLSRSVWCRDTDTAFDIDARQVRDALARACANRTAHCERKPDDTDLARRRRDVETIAAYVFHTLDLFDGLNAELRARSALRCAA